MGRFSRGRSKHLGGGGQKIEGRGMGGERHVTVRGRKRDNKEDKDRRKRRGVCVCRKGYKRLSIPLSLSEQ